MRDTQKGVPAFCSVLGSQLVRTAVKFFLCFSYCVITAFLPSVYIFLKKNEKKIEYRVSDIAVIR